jgi:predicted secreted acid phosphatase
VMQGARPFLRERAAQAGPDARLAINLDIDNTSLATYYDRGAAVRKVRNAARLATRLGYTVLFNTGRLQSRLRGVRAELTRAGYAVGAICTRDRGELLPVGKQQCRASFVAEGYTIVANVGNNDSDFEGSDYERAFRLPNYDGALG